jgi:hypothetical protein
MSDDSKKDQAQAALTGCGIEAGQVYRHYKGGIYVVMAVSIKEDTLEPMVTYRSHRKRGVWTRTLANFIEMVPCNPDAPASHHYHVSRFEWFTE